jgi:hypothetical protein
MSNGDILKDHIAFIFKGKTVQVLDCLPLDDEQKILQTFRISIISHPREHNIAEDLNPQQHCYQNPKCYLYTITVILTGNA